MASLDLTALDQQARDALDRDLAPALRAPVVA
jgi:hypothetical protein